MIAAILASTNTGGIGLNGTLPWPKHSEDLKWFKEHTSNQIVVMGRKTWDDPMMPKPLPNRINCVVSSNPVAIEHRQQQVKWLLKPS
jgi:dihydrofolate reductase